MKMYRIFVATCLLTTVINCYQEERRDPKWFITRRTLTSVILRHRLVTEMIPSSCVILESTLQPCRNVRRLDIKPSPPRKIQSTEAPAQMLQHQILNKSPLEPSNDGGNWFWGAVTTVTQVTVSDVTVKVQDPNTVITFSIKGCKPSKLPFDLPYCSIDNSKVTSASAFVHTLRTAELYYIQD